MTAHTHYGALDRAIGTLAPRPRHATLDTPPTKAELGLAWAYFTGQTFDPAFLGQWMAKPDGAVPNAEPADNDAAAVIPFPQASGFSEEDGARTGSDGTNTEDEKTGPVGIRADWIRELLVIDTLIATHQDLGPIAERTLIVLVLNFIKAGVIYEDTATALNENLRSEFNKLYNSVEQANESDIEEFSIEAYKRVIIAFIDYFKERSQQISYFYIIGNLAGNNNQGGLLTGDFRDFHIRGNLDFSGIQTPRRVVISDTACQLEDGNKGTLYCANSSFHSLEISKFELESIEIINTTTSMDLILSKLKSNSLKINKSIIGRNLDIILEPLNDDWLRHLDTFKSTHKLEITNCSIAEQFNLFRANRATLNNKPVPIFDGDIVLENTQCRIFSDPIDLESHDKSTKKRRSSSTVPLKYQTGYIRLRGFLFERFRYGNFECCDQRLKWLSEYTDEEDRQGPNFKPMPWDVTAAAVQRAGFFKQARRIQMRKEYRIDEAQMSNSAWLGAIPHLILAGAAGFGSLAADFTIPGMAAFPSTLLIVLTSLLLTSALVSMTTGASTIFWFLRIAAGYLTGYGYALHRLGAVSVLLLVCGFVAFSAANMAGLMQQRADLAMLVRIANTAEGVIVYEYEDPDSDTVRRVRTMPERSETASDAADHLLVPPFNPFVYTLDVFVPAVEFGQEAAWELSEPQPNDAFWTRLLAGIRHFLIAAGWVLTSLLIAGVTGLIQRDRHK